MRIGSVALLSVLVGRLTANAQATPTPAATPVPSCAINTLPDNSQTECTTGAETPPSFLGVSGGNYRSVTAPSKTGGISCCSGTFGALVQNSSSTQFVLGSNHVLARTSSAGGSAVVRERIVQPGLEELGCWQDSSDTVARLSAWAPINFSGGENQLDAAIARVVQAPQGPAGPMVPGINTSGEILNIGQISTTPFPFDSLIDGLPVMKMGRSSCLTLGVVEAWDAAGLVVYRNTCNNAATGKALFDHQILIFGEVPGGATSCSFASTGDSGALVVTNDFTCPQAIGLVFAGASGTTADSGGVVVAVNPIKTVLKQFGVSLVGKTCTASPIERQIDSATRQPATISEALRASIEHVRSVKEAHARNLLNQNGVVAVGIGGGNTPDTAALKVYITEDIPQVRNAVTSEVATARVCRSGSSAAGSRRCDDRRSRNRSAANRDLRPATGRLNRRCLFGPATADRPRP